MAKTTNRQTELQTLLTQLNLTAMADVSADIAMIKGDTTMSGLDRSTGQGDRVNQLEENSNNQGPHPDRRRELEWQHKRFSSPSRETKPQTIEEQVQELNNIWKPMLPEFKKQIKDFYEHAINEKLHGMTSKELGDYLLQWETNKDQVIQEMNLPSILDKEILIPEQDFTRTGLDTENIKEIVGRKVQNLRVELAPRAIEQIIPQALKRYKRFRQIAESVAEIARPINCIICHLCRIY